MKDGTELTHYGVKGMKWGKKLFGKVKGVFGKPKPEHQTTYASIRDAGAKRFQNLNAAYNKGKISYANLDNRSKQSTRMSLMQEHRHSKAMGLNAIREKEASDKYANALKRNSKRINGR